MRNDWKRIILKSLKTNKRPELNKEITGIRRCGKSTLLETFMNELLKEGVATENIIFINFEERENLHLIGQHFMTR